MDPEVAILAGLTGFVGGLLGSLATKIAERRVTKLIDEAEASRDLIVQLASALSSFEGFLHPLTKPFTAGCHADLATFESGYDVSPFPVTPEKLLAIFSGVETHRLLLLLSGRLDLFTKRATDHRAAYYWLLDHPGSDWSTPAHQERLANIAKCREDMLT